jgi:hypothetical protein
MVASTSASVQSLPMHVRRAAVGGCVVSKAPVWQRVALSFECTAALRLRAPGVLPGCGW